ncbi:MAG: PQQ-binding-like beta-propeller repeat protein, partial [Actinobacteria bacterium]|nr:PQQ-binding-like beta-propeller repeat protein [Actinomycetota bacterium]
VVGGRVIVTTWGGRVSMLDGWSTPLPGPSLGPPAAASGVVVASWEGGVLAFDAASGHVRWQRQFEGADTSAPAVIGDLAVVVGGDRRAHGIDLSTGNDRWSIAMSGAGAPEAPPAVRGQRVALVDRLGHLVVADAHGHRLWSADGHGAVVRGAPVWVGDAVAMPLDDGRIMVARGHRPLFDDPPGRVSGAAAAGSSLIVATREATTNGLFELRREGRE